MKKLTNRVLINALVNTLSFILASSFLPITAVTPFHFLMAGIILALINQLIRPILIILVIPLNLLTLGLFTLVINTWMILLTSGLVPGFHVSGFGIAFLISLFISLVNWAVKKSV